MQLGLKELCKAQKQESLRILRPSEKLGILMEKEYICYEIQIEQLHQAL